MANLAAAIVRSTGQSWRSGVLISVVLALGLSQLTPRSIGAATAGTDRPAAVNLSVDVDLKDLHPAASEGALQCGAVVQTPDWIAAHRADLVDYDSFVKWVGYAAHYLGQDTKVAFPVTERRYTGTLRVRLTLSPSAFNDPATRAPWSTAPQALVACWLMINGRPAVWDHNGAALVASATNFASVTASPLAVAIVPASPSASVSAAAKLRGQGHFFVPGRLALSANVQISGSSSVTHARKAPGPAQTATQVPTPIVLQAQFDAGGGFLGPAALTIGTTLSSAGTFVAPMAAEIPAQFNSAGGFVTPLPLNVDGTMSSSGSFVTPAAITLQATFSAGGNFASSSR
jgi:hypothetical protein